MQVASTDAHFEQILQLQRRNHFSAIDAEAQRREGFVFAQHSDALLKRMAALLPQAIAVSDGRVVGYNLAMPIEMKQSIPSLVPMFAQFDRSEFRGRPLSSYRYVVGGQVCVDAAFRGHGLLGRLYRHTRDNLHGGEEVCVTEVAARNPVSIIAHRKAGFVDIAQYNDGAELWHVVAWGMERD